MTDGEERLLKAHVKNMSNGDLFDAATMQVDEHSENFDWECTEADMAVQELSDRLRKIGFLEKL